MMCAASLPNNLISKVIISDNWYSLKMNQECKEYLLAHMQVKLEREPNMKPSGMKSWLLVGEQKFDLTHDPLHIHPEEQGQVLADRQCCEDKEGV